MSISPASSMRFSSVGTPATSSTSWVSRWKTGAMFTYEIRLELDHRRWFIGVVLRFMCQRFLSTTASTSASSSSRRTAPSRFPPRARAWSRASSRETARAHRSPRRGRERPRAALPRAPAGRPRPRGRQGGAAVSACRRAGRCRRDLPGLDGLAAAVEDVVDDLERDPEQSAEVGAALSEDARRREERAGLERTNARDRRPPSSRDRAVAGAGALRRARAPATPRRGTATGACGACCGERGEGRGEKVVVRRARGVGAVRSTPQHGRGDMCAVDDVVVDQRRHVDEPTATPSTTGASAPGGAERNVSVGRSRLPPRSQRVGADRRDGAGMCRDDQLEALLDRDEVVGEPVDRADGLERANDGSPRTRRRSAARRSSRPSSGSGPARSLSARAARQCPLRPGSAARWPGGTCTPCRRDDLAEERHDPVEPEREERPQDSARLRDLEDREAPPGRSTSQLAQSGS